MGLESDLDTATEAPHMTFAASVDRHGSIDGCLEQALGVDADLRTRIGERLTE